MVAVTCASVPTCGLIDQVTPWPAAPVPPAVNTWNWFCVKVTEVGESVTFTAGTSVTCALAVVLSLAVTVMVTVVLEGMDEGAVKLFG